MSDQVAADILGLTAQIVPAHLSKSQVETEALPSLIQSVYRSLSTAGEVEPAAAPLQAPAVPIKKSVFPDYIVCLEDGKKLKMLKRYLQTRYGLSADAYRAKWASRATTRWSRPTMPPPVRAWPSNSVWGASRHRPRRPSPRCRSCPHAVHAAPRPDPAGARRSVSVTASVDKMVGMFTVDEPTAEAIRRAVEDGGELSGVVELRRHFPLITDNVRLDGACR